MRNQNRIERVINKTLENNTERIFKGKVQKIAPLRNRKNKLRRGSPVLTPEGMGTIISHGQDMWDTNRVDKSVLIDLNHKYPKTFNISNLTQLAIYHKPTDQFILLSPNCYGYIYKENQIVSYRITKRRYAMLTDELKVELEVINTIQKKRGGIRTIHELDKAGIVMIIPGEELHYSPSKLLNDLLVEKFNNIRNIFKRS